MEPETMKEEVAKGKASVMARANFFAQQIESAGATTTSSPLTPPPQQRRQRVVTPTTPLTAESVHPSGADGAAIPATPTAAAFPTALHSSINERREFFMSEASKLKEQDAQAEKIKQLAEQRQEVRKAEREAYVRAEREALERLRREEESRARELEQKEARRRDFEDKARKFNEGGRGRGGGRPAWR